MKSLFKTTIEIWTLDPLDGLDRAANDLLDCFNTLGVVTKTECQEVSNPVDYPDTHYFNDINKKDRLS